MVGSDSQVVEQVASVVSVPREDPGDSFILHAPLETLARFALLQLVTPDDRGPVLDRIRDVGRQYDAWGPAYAHEPDRQVNRTTDHVSELVEAIETADSEMADNAISSMAATMGTTEMVAALAGPVLPATAAAAHGNILLYLLPRIAPRSDAAAAMARTTVHELMRGPRPPVELVSEHERRLPRSRAELGGAFDWPHIRPSVNGDQRCRHLMSWVSALV